MKNDSKKAFTLIELLVVIAIISILITIVLTLTGYSRNKTKDVTIKTEMKSLYTQAEMIFNNIGCYANSDYTGGPACPGLTSNACPASPSNSQYLFYQTDLVAISSSIFKKNDSSNYYTICSTNSGKAWSFITVSNVDRGKAFCIDSTSSEIKTIPANAGDPNIKYPSNDFMTILSKVPAAKCTP
jgi:prepilin-type N-terminal cleavage/methylation domain-containing protein